MNSSLLTTCIILCCLLASTTGCTQTPPPNDLALARVKGPAKRVVMTTYASPGKEEDDRAGFPNRMATHRVVINAIVADYNKKGMLTYWQQAFWDQEKGCLIRSYRVMNGTRGTTFDNEGHATGTIAINWADAHTKIEKTLDGNGRLLAEETCLLNDANQIDTTVNKRFENGTLSQTYYQQISFSGKGDLKRSVTWNLADEATKRTTDWAVLERDSYGNVLKMQSTVGDNNQWVTEYRYTYYGTAGEQLEKK